MLRLPPPLARAVDDVVAELGTAAVTRTARALSERYLADRPADVPIVDTDLRAAAYLLTRMPATFAAGSAALAELAAAVPALQPQRVLDLGAGTGALSWAASETFRSVTDVALVDYAPDALRLADRLLAGSRVRRTTAVRRLGARVTAVPTPADAAADLAMCGFVLGELDERARTAVVDELIASAPTVLVVEPGTPAGYRRILDVRAQLIGAGMHLAAPCPHHEQCPLAAGDWCHMAVRLERSVAHREAKGGVRDFEDEKFSYVAATRLDVAPPSGRVLRHPQVRPGHVLLELCQPSGAAERVTVSKKQGASYRSARRLEWGRTWPPRGSAPGVGGAD